jgi:flagellar hook protein FlgE
MPSTTALFTGLSGLNANSRNIDVIGNNIANVNTTAFKSSRLMFSTVFSRNLGLGSSPSEASGGTNPFQIGLGVKAAGTQRNTTGGSVSATGDGRDLALDGAGYFIVNRGGEDLYTRAGAFRQNNNNDLTTISGETLRGFGVDSSFRIVPGRLVDLNLPVGALTLAEATRNIAFSGNLNSDGVLPTQGSNIQLMGTATQGFAAKTTAAPAPTPPNVIESDTRLIDIADPLVAGGGTSLFSAGQVIELRGAEKGNKTVPSASYTISTASTVQDLTAFLTEALGIDPTVLNPDGKTPGVAIDPQTGVISVVGNAGKVNDLAVETADLRLNSSAGVLIRSPFTSTKSTTADGESVRTTVVAFDSLGSPVELDVSMVLDSRSSAGTTWRYFVESADDSDVELQVATGTISFDTQGQPTTTAPVSIAVDRAGSAAASPLAIDLNFARSPGGVTSLSDDTSTLAATGRDGAPMGTLANFAVGPDGVISGSFTNGMIRTLGQVALGTFANPEGLVDVGGSLFRPGANSGEAVQAAPGTLGTGQIISGALELSNVDLGEEFIKMILSSTGYSASSRVIKTTEELMQQLLVLGR